MIIRKNKMASHNELGKRGEDIARKYLESKNYVIIDQNWRFRKWEIDLVALKDDLIVIVEVKTRSQPFSDISDLIGEKKEENILEAANAYMENQEENLECRIDLVIIQTKVNSSDVIHIEDAITQA